MTKTTLEQLSLFLNQYAYEIKEDFLIADYGGTESIGGNVVKGMLEKGGVHNYKMLDYDNGVDLLKPVKGKKFDLGICMDLLEHTTNPILIAENIRKSLKKGALLFVTVPTIWELHYYPKDYWRFAPQGVLELFKKMEVLTIYQIRDHDPEEAVPRVRVIGIFRKI